MNHSANNSAMAYKGNAEPLMEEMLRDPIVRQLMASDNVSESLIDTLQEHIAQMRDQLSTNSVQ